MQQGTAILRELRHSDIPELIVRYQGIQITAKNCVIRLDSSADCSFEQMGGMYAIPTVPELECMVEQPGQYFTRIACDHKGQILGFVWMPLQPAAPERLKGIQYSESVEQLRNTLNLAAVDKTLLWGGEILVDPGRRIPGLAIRLMEELFCSIAKRDGIHMLGEVYRVTGYQIHGQMQEVDGYNTRSHRLLLRTGGRLIGHLSESELALPGFSVRIQPALFYWNIPKAAECCQRQQVPIPC